MVLLGILDVCVPPCSPDSGRDPFNQNSDRSDREKWPTSKGGPVFLKLGLFSLTLLTLTMLLERKEVGV